MKPPRWTAVTEPAFPWEGDALDFLRSHLPDHEPWRAWANFEFIDDEGRVNEVDVLVLTPAGLMAGFCGEACQHRGPPPRAHPPRRTRDPL
jgi:hypothetical protein